MAGRFQRNLICSAIKIGIPWVAHRGRGESAINYDWLVYSWSDINLVIFAHGDGCDDFRSVVIQVAGVRVLDVEGCAGVIVCTVE